jgi:beta-N-acetylhexosaminidase
LGLPVLQESLEELMENELYPFIKGIEHDVDSIMIGHLAVPALNDGKDTSATLSKSIIETLLRKQLKYDGLVISDALNMHSVSKLYDTKGQLEWEAFNAGNDVLCFAENVPEGIQEILKNASPERIEASYIRLMKCKEKAGLLTSNSDAMPELDFETAAMLNRKIAQKSITKIKDNNNTAVVLEAAKSGKLAKLSLYKNTDNIFFKTLAPTLASAEFSVEMDDEKGVEELEKNLTDYDTILISLFVPKAKPMNNFDIEETVLRVLKKVFDTKKCILYVFGNPYSLQIIPNLKSTLGIVQVYQDFPEFQESAALQLLGNIECKGALPVFIKEINTP